jgi:hypothetical protein
MVAEADVKLGAGPDREQQQATGKRSVRAGSRSQQQLKTRRRRAIQFLYHNT